MTRVLYVVACASPPVHYIADMITASQAREWNVCLVLTPSARLWLSGQIEGLSALTGYPVRDAYKLPGEPDALPPADAIAVTPASANTINKWAAGLGDNLALGLITEAIGKGVPLVAIPFVNVWQAAHPAFDQSVATLRAAGVTVLLDESGSQSSHVAGGFRSDDFPWSRALDALEPG